MTNSVAIEIRSVAPQLMRRWPGEKPTPPRTTKKTLELIQKRMKAEWLEALYLRDGVVGLPNDNIFSCLLDGAARLRSKDAVRCGVYVVEEFVPLRVYSGPDDNRGRVLQGDPDTYYKNEHIDIRGVCLNPKAKTRGDRCRPIFRHWGLTFHLCYDGALIDHNLLKQVLEKAGDFVGLGDYRPRFGRFRLVGFAPAGEVA